jgi:hypothetical protein
MVEEPKYIGNLTGNEGGGGGEDGEAKGRIG